MTLINPFKSTETTADVVTKESNVKEDVSLFTTNKTYNEVETHRYSVYAKVEQSILSEPTFRKAMNRYYKALDYSIVNNESFSKDYNVFTVKQLGRLIQEIRTHYKYK